VTVAEIKDELVMLGWDELCELFTDSLAAVNVDYGLELGEDDLDEDDLEPVVCDELTAMVKTWYREKSRQVHPDHGGSTESQAIVNEVAHDLLEMIGRRRCQADGSPPQ
jgi:hypothetical protein